MTNAPTPGKSVPSAPELLKAAEVHFQAGRAAEAEVALRALLKVYPENADALFALGLVAFNAEKVEAAIQLIEEAIVLNPNAGRFHTNISPMYQRMGQLDKAIEHGRIAVTLKPAHSESHNNLGVAYSAKGNATAALEHFDRAIELDPKNVDALCNRANQLNSLHRYTEAEVNCRHAIELQPSNPVPYNSLACSLRGLDNPAAAEEFLRKALTVRPGDRITLHNLILALNDQKKFDEALAVAEQTLQAFPTSAPALSMAGSIHLEKKNYDAALRLINQSLALDSDDVETIHRLGLVYFETNQLERAAKTFQSAVDINPAYADAYNSLGSALGQLGRFDEAMIAFDKCLMRTPRYFAAYANLVEAKTFQSDSDPHLKTMEAHAENYSDVPQNQQMYLRFSLSKAYDDLGRFDEAFQNMNVGCEIKRQSATYDEENTLRLFERIRTAFSPELAKRQLRQSAPGPSPIFILGMPRSGTTLVEQILSSHRKVSGGGEVRDVHDSLVDLRGHMINHLAFPELLAEAGPSDLAMFASSYARRMSRRHSGAEFATDKMPSNFFFLGLLFLAMPNAKIIHTRRNPIDTCFSCYSKLFTGEINYTYDQATLGRYYRSYDRLMQHWRDVLPASAFLDVNYEDVVADKESQARRMLDYCGLDWDAQVLDFYKNERPVKTASMLQVRKPIYSSSVLRWKNYEKHLGPLMAELGDLAK